MTERGRLPGTVSCMKARAALLVAGPVVVTCYAAAMVLLITVWDPIAAMPSMSYREIVNTLSAAGVDVIAEYWVLSMWGALGAVIAVVLSVLCAKLHLSAWGVIRWQLAVLAAGAPAYFIASFPLGMGVADTFGVSGAPHTPWTGLLYLVSAAAFVTLVAGAVAQMFREAKRSTVVSA